MSVSSTQVKTCLADLKHRERIRRLNLGRKIAQHGRSENGKNIARERDVIWRYDYA
jgi:hypothetical protein